MRLSHDVPVGRPSFALSSDQVATVLDIVVRGADAARQHVRPGMFEVPITLLVRKAMRRVKKRLGLTNLQIRGEHELDDMESDEPTVPGRIDIILELLHQFGDEDAYVAVECKRVGARQHSLNRLYVAEGVNRFVSGQYARGHEWGMMLGYVIAMPVAESANSIDRRIQKTYGRGSRLTPGPAHALAAAVHTGRLLQAGGPHIIRLLHIFVEMTSAATGGASRRAQAASIGAERGRSKRPRPT